eukprot:4047126-Pyramimonas_sp.AAC.1
MPPGEVASHVQSSHGLRRLHTARPAAAVACRLRRPASSSQSSSDSRCSPLTIRRQVSHAASRLAAWDRRLEAHELHLQPPRMNVLPSRPQ